MDFIGVRINSKSSINFKHVTMKSLSFLKNFNIVQFIVVFSFCSCGSEDDKGSTSFSCDSYWSKVDFNSVCDLGFPNSFVFDSPPQAGATTLCLADVLENSKPNYNGNIIISKTPSNSNATSAYEAKKSGVSSSNDMQDFDAGGEKGFIVKISGTETYDYTAVKGVFLIQYSASVEPATHPCLTKANHDAYMRALVAKL
jgi:hypothetical protein